LKCNDRGRSFYGNALFFIQSVAITVVATAIAVIISIIPTPVMVVIAAMIAVVVPAMAVVIIKVCNAATEQYGGGYGQQHRCSALHSTLP
jgi:hypothetical protein